MLYLLIVLTGLTIGLAKAGFAGVGAVNVPLLAVIVNDPSFAVGVILPMLIAGDFTVGWRFFGQWDKRLVLTMLPGAIAGVALGAPILNTLSGNTEIFERAIGVVALVFTLLQMVLEKRRTEQPGDEHQPAPVWAGLLAGTLTGIVSTVAHQGGLVTNLYLLNQRLTKERFAATAMGLYCALNLTKLIPYLQQGKINPETFHYSLVGLPFVVLGVLLGAQLLKKISPKFFANFILWLTLLVGLKLAIAP